MISRRHFCRAGSWAGTAGCVGCPRLGHRPHGRLRRLPKARPPEWYPGDISAAETRCATSSTRIRGMRRTAILTFLVLVAVATETRVTRMEITSRKDIWNGRYELLTGRVYFAVDPA